MRKSDNRKPGAGKPFKKEGGSFKRSSGGEKREDRPSRPARGGSSRSGDKTDKGPRPFDKFRKTEGESRSSEKGKDKFAGRGRSSDRSGPTERGKGFRKDSERPERSGPGRKDEGFGRDKFAGRGRSEERSGPSERRSFRKDDAGGERRGSDKKEESYGRDQFAGRGRSDERSKPSERRSFRKDDAGGERRGSDKKEESYGRDQFAGRGRSDERSKPSERRSFKKDDASGERRSFRKDGDSDERKAPAKRESGYGTEATPKRKGRGSRDEDESIKRVKFDEFEDGKVFSNRNADRTTKGRKPGKKPVAKQESADGMIRLNKYLSNAGIASRREADTLIESGAVKVNGVVVSTLGYKVGPNDKVSYGDQAVRSERKVYLLLNKPKDYITTTDDPQERKTVMELIAKACRERVYPVGRLDRNTTGLLLFTNDGEMTTKLTHPKFGVKKVYHVSLNKGLKPDDFKAISEGVELEDGIVKADDIAFVGEGKKEIGIEIHSGRNRIVRRIFEHLGYDVLKLDRVAFAGLTKKDLPRGKYRFLTAKEIGFLQMVG